MTLLLKNVLKQRDEEAGYRLLVRHFAVDSGEYVAITGPSGCGKSTTLDLIGMLLRPDSADCFQLATKSGAEDIFPLWQKGRKDVLTELRRRNLGYVLQTGELLPFLSVEENILLSAETAGLDRKTAKKRAAELMERLDIVRLRRALPRTLSIGERQRAAIARATVPSPRLLLADEPTAALDPGLSRKVMKLFLDIVKESRTSIVMVSHDVDLVHEFAFREVPITVERGDDGSITARLDDRKGGC